jgi:hypothetical protein
MDYDKKLETDVVTSTITLEIIATKLLLTAFEIL